MLLGQSQSATTDDAQKKFIWLPNMTKRTADVAGLANLITPSGKRVRELLSSVKKRVTPNAADTNEDVLFLSPLNQVQFRADTDGEGNDLREGGRQLVAVANQSVRPRRKVPCISQVHVRRKISNCHTNRHLDFTTKC